MTMIFIMKHLHLLEIIGGTEDINLHLKYNKNFKHFNLSSNLVYIRSLNYQWELDDYATPYYHPGRDVDNFHLSLKLTYCTVKF